jgi:hypothetical protein
MFFDALRWRPSKTLKKQCQVDAVLLSIFQGGRQFFPFFHSSILASRCNKQKWAQRWVSAWRLNPPYSFSCDQKMVGSDNPPARTQ